MDTLLTRTRRAPFDVATLRFFYDVDGGDPHDDGDDGGSPADPGHLHRLHHLHRHAA